MTVTQLVSRGPVTRAAVSASQLSPERDVIGLCALCGPTDRAGRVPLATSMGSHPLSAVMEKGH